jgi:hypothetical protein
MKMFKERKIFMTARGLCLFVILYSNMLAAQSRDCSPIPVAVFKAWDFDAVAAHNFNEGNFLIVWHRMVMVDRFTNTDSPNGRIVNQKEAISSPRNYSFGSNEGRMADRSLSAAYNPNFNEFFITWFEIPELGLNHTSGLYFRRIDRLGIPKGSISKIT